MRSRFWVIFSLAVFRILLNFQFTKGNGVTEVWFKSIKPMYSSSECIIHNREYWAVGKIFCRLEAGTDYLVSGRRRSGLIDRLMGRIWLDEPRISQVRAGKSGRLAEWRSYLVGKTEKFLPEPESALVLGVVLGYKGSLSREFYQALVNSGTIHMVVASGYNVMIVASLLLSILMIFFRRGIATVVVLAITSGYVLLTGAEMSILRAGIMAFFVLLGTAMGRVTKSWWSLCLAIWFMFMVEPVVVVDISFQLSVAATTGLVVLAPHLSKRIRQGRMTLAPLIERLDLLTTVCAILATWPVIWFHFGRGSLAPLISNTVILPLVPILMGLGAVLMILAVMVEPLAGLIALPTYSVAHLIVILVRWFGQ